MQPGLVNTHDLFIDIVSALMLSIRALILKALDYSSLSCACISSHSLVCSNVCKSVLLHLTYMVMPHKCDCTSV